MKRLALLLCLLPTLAFGQSVGGLIHGGASTSSTPPADSAPNIVLTTSCPTAVSSSPAGVSGVASDDVTVASVTGSTVAGACSIDGTSTWSALCPVTAGANTATFIVTDNVGGVGHTAQIACSITLTSPDGFIPTIVISTATGFATSGSSIGISGTAGDDISVASVKCRVNGGAFVTMSGTLTWSGTLSLTLGANTIECKSIDTAAKESTLASISGTRSAGGGLPTITITSSTPTNGGTSTTGLITFTGTAQADNGLSEGFCGTENKFTIGDMDGSIRFQNWKKAQGTIGQPGYVPAFPVNSQNWSLSGQPMKIGSYTYYCVAFDNALPQNMAEAHVTVTYTPTDPIIITMGCPPARTGTAYQCDLEGDLGDGTYTWDNGSPLGTSLAGGGAACGGLTITDVVAADGYHVGRIAGSNPTTTGNCAAPWRVCDSGGQCVSGTRTVAVQATALTGPHDHWNALVARPEALAIPECVAAGTPKGCSLRTTAEITSMTGGANTTYVATADYSRLTWVPRDVSQSSDSMPVTDQPKATINKNTGTLIVQFQAYYEQDMRAFNCRRGVMDVFSEPNGGHKEFIVRSNEDSIFWETRSHPDDTKVNGPFPCWTMGAIDHRLYGNNGGEEPRPTAVVRDAPPTPAGGTAPPCSTSTSPAIYGTQTPATYAPAIATWIEYTMEIRLNRPYTEFTDWNTCTGATLTAGGTGLYHMVSAWAQSEWDAYPRRLLFRVPVNNYAIKQAITYARDYAAYWDGHHNMSAGPGSRLSSVHSRERNLSILLDYTSAAWLSSQPEDDTVVFAGPPRR